MRPIPQQASRPTIRAARSAVRRFNPVERTVAPDDPRSPADVPQAKHTYREPRDYSVGLKPLCLALSKTYANGGAPSGSISGVVSGQNSQGITKLVE